MDRLIERIKSMDATELFPLTLENRDNIPEKLTRMVEAYLQDGKKPDADS